MKARTKRRQGCECGLYQFQTECSLYPTNSAVGLVLVALVLLEKNLHNPGLEDGPRDGGLLAYACDTATIGPFSKFYYRFPAYLERSAQLRVDGSDPHADEEASMAGVREAERFGGATDGDDSAESAEYVAGMEDFDVRF